MAALVLARAVTANDLFKSQYGRTLRWAGGLAVVALAVLVLTLPEFHPTPYQLPGGRELVIEEIELLRPIERPLVAPPQAPVMPNIEPSADPEALPTIDVPELMPVPYDAPFVATSARPRLVQGARADYPEMARLAGLQGLVMVKVLVGVDGRVEQVELLKGVHPLIDRPALAAARRLVFTPGTQRDIPVPCFVAVPFRFSLD